MRATVGAVAIAIAAAVSPAAFQEPAPAGSEVLAEVRVHGNHSTPDAEIVSLEGLTLGAPLPPDAAAAVEQR
jgi:hypothetical protein